MKTTKSGIIWLLRQSLRDSKQIKNKEGRMYYRGGIETAIGYLKAHDIVSTKEFRRLKKEKKLALSKE